MTSIRYAVRYETPQSDWELDQYERPTNYYSYNPVPKSLAEGDDQNGMCAVFTNSGDQASLWVPVNDEWVHAELLKIKEFPALNDMFNTPLAVGDYALSAFDDRSNYLSLCRVVGFTKNQVKVHNLNWNRVVSRKSSMLVRVHELVITPEP
jgi:hypothetical protein